MTMESLKNGMDAPEMKPGIKILKRWGEIDRIKKQIVEILEAHQVSYEEWEGILRDFKSFFLAKANG